MLLQLNFKEYHRKGGEKAGTYLRYTYWISYLP